MGIGFCYVVEAASAERTLAILKQHGRAAQVIGTAVSDPQKIVRIPARGLAAQHKRFWREGRGRAAGGVITATRRWPLLASEFRRVAFATYAE